MPDLLNVKEWEKICKSSDATDLGLKDALGRYEKLTAKKPSAELDEQEQELEELVEALEEVVKVAQTTRTKNAKLKDAAAVKQVKSHLDGVVKDANDSLAESRKKLATFEASDDPAVVLGKSEAFAAYLRKSLKKLKKKPSNFAIGLGSKPEDTRIVFHKSYDGQKLVKSIKEATDLKKFAWGLAASKDKDLVFALESPPIGGIKKKGELMLKEHKLLPLFDTIVLMVDGNIVEDLKDPDDPDTGKAAGGGATNELAEKLLAALTKFAPLLEKAIQAHPDRKSDLLKTVAAIRETIQGERLAQAQTDLLALGKLLQSLVAATSAQPATSDSTSSAPSGDEAECKRLKLVLYPQVKEAVVAHPDQKEEVIRLLGMADKHEKATAYASAIETYRELSTLLASLSGAQDGQPAKPSSPSAPSGSNGPSSPSTPSGSSDSSDSSVPTPPPNGPTPPPSGPGAPMGPRQGAPKMPVKPVAKPTVPPVGLNTPISKAFKDKLAANMFNLEHADEVTVNSHCLKFNYAMFNAKKVTGSDKLLEAMIAKGLPKSGTTGSVNVDLLPEFTKEIWRLFNEGNKAVQEEIWVEEGKKKEDFVFALQELPSIETIRESMVEWKSNPKCKPEDDITKFRAASIGTAKLDPTQPQKALITEAALNEANNKLKAMGSFVQLEKAGPEEGGFFPVRPVFGTANIPKPDAKGRDDHMVVQAINAKRQETASPGAATGDKDKFVSWADCHRTSQMVMGSEDQPIGSENIERPVLRGAKGTMVVEPISMMAAKAIPLGSNSAANRAMHGFFTAAMPNFAGDFKKKTAGELTPGEAAVLGEMENAEREQKLAVLQANLGARMTVALKAAEGLKATMTVDKDKDALDERLKAIGELIAGKADKSDTSDDKGDMREKESKRLDAREMELANAAKTMADAETDLKVTPEADKPRDIPVNYRNVYRAICNDPELYDKFSRDFGVNDYVRPEPGDAITQVNDEGMKSRDEKAGKDIWNFHWAGVVLTNPDGSYMTLENLSVEDSRAVNTDWYFAVYEAGAKSGKPTATGAKPDGFTPGNRSFHEVNKADPHVTDYPLTMAIKKTT